MLDDRLGRHSVAVLALVILPLLVVIGIFADGMAHPGRSHGPWIKVVVFAAPPTAAFLLAFANHRRVARSFVLALAAFVMIGVWYVLLMLPDAAICTVVRGNSCM
jgi:hypothetical protein